MSAETCPSCPGCIEPTCGHHWRCGCPLDRAPKSRVDTHQIGDSWVASTRRPCGHEYHGYVRWNTEPEARAHGVELLKTKCSTCQEQKRAQRRAS